MDNRTEQLADGVWRVEVGFYVNAFVLANDGRGDAAGITVVDTGTRAAAPRLVRSVRLLGLDPRRISDVLLTHWHGDHSGSAARFARSSARSRVHVGEHDLAAVRGDAGRPHGLTPARDRSRVGRLLPGFPAPGAPVPDARPLEDGRQLPVAGGLQVVAAPGHTAGHLAFLLPERGVLLAGDAVFNVLTLSRGPRPVRAPRGDEATTLCRLADLDFSVLAPGHGPPITDRARQRLARLADRASGDRTR